MDDRRFSRVFPLAGQVVHQYTDNVSRVLFCMEKKKNQASAVLTVMEEKKGAEGNVRIC